MDKLLYNNIHQDYISQNITLSDEQKEALDYVAAVKRKARELRDKKFGTWRNIHVGTMSGGRSYGKSLKPLHYLRGDLFFEKPSENEPGVTKQELLRAHYKLQDEKTPPAVRVLPDEYVR